MYQKLKPNERFVHNETTTTIDDTKVVITADGMVTIHQTDDEGEDIVNIKAGTIFKIGNLLRATRKLVKNDRSVTANQERFDSNSK